MLLLLLFGVSLFAQEATEIYLFELNKSESTYSISNPINISENEHGYTIDFIDNGPGFTKSIINNAFDSFKSTKNGKGAGLGLYISYNIIRDHGGTIRIDSEYNNGSHIIITIPNKGVLHDGKSD